MLGVGAIILDGDRVLLVERGKPPQQGLWSLPGGAVETGETLDAAVRREILEETGLKIEPLSVVEVFERITRDAAGAVEYHYVLIDYLCRVTGGTLEARDDAARVEWVPRADLASRRITSGTIPVIEKAFRASSRPRAIPGA
ncbi:MAG: NUDIX hydrolase [Candidatus Solibacter usitatus]|nr:NUDIX hydrolase [Candidatus Solibacter usitatus]